MSDPTFGYLLLNQGIKGITAGIAKAISAATQKRPAKFRDIGAERPFSSDEIVKKNINDASIQDFINVNNAKTYKHKSPENGIKMVNISHDKFNPVVLALLANLNKRLSKLEK